MKFSISEEERLAAASAKKFAEERLRKNVLQLDEREEFDFDSFREAFEHGFCGLMIPEEFGGSGTDPLVAMAVLEELGAGSPSFALSLGASFLLFGHNLAREGSDHLKKKHLPDISTGRKIGAMALTEPLHGSDAAGIETRAERSGGGFVLNGSKTFITNAPIADLFLVYARDKKPDGDISAFVVERGYKGVATGKPLRKMGNRSSPTGEVFFDGCEVPAENLVGEEGKGVYAMMRSLDVERIVLPSIYLGAMKWAIEISKQYSLSRKQFGRSISEYQLIQSKLANMAVMYESAKAYLREVAAQWKKNPGDRSLRGSAAASKLLVGRAVEYATREAVQILGGAGYMRDSIVEMLCRDCRLASIGAGTEEMEELLVFRGLMEGDFV